MLDPKEVRKKYLQFLELYPEYNDKLVIDYLQFEAHHVYDEWAPKPIEVLFLAESPSKDRQVYFYDKTCGTGLSKYVLEFLGITQGTKTQRLEEFKRRGFFLTDTISCIYKKKRSGGIPLELIRFSVKEILKQEIENLAPKTIVVLGGTALSGLKIIKKFQPALSEISSIRNIEIEKRKIQAGDTTLILSIYPGRQTIQYHKEIEATFRLISN